MRLDYFEDLQATPARVLLMHDFGASDVHLLLEAVRGQVPAFVREVEVFDQYRGKGIEPGQKSLALRIVMQDTARTLTDSEVEAVMTSIRDQLLRQFKAKPRT